MQLFQFLQDELSENVCNAFPTLNPNSCLHKADYLPTDYPQFYCVKSTFY